MKWEERKNDFVIKILGEAFQIEHGKADLLNNIHPSSSSPVLLSLLDLLEMSLALLAHLDTGRLEIYIFIDLKLFLVVKV